MGDSWCAWGVNDTALIMAVGLNVATFTYIPLRGMYVNVGFQVRCW